MTKHNATDAAAIAAARAYAMSALNRSFWNARDAAEEWHRAGPTDQKAKANAMAAHEKWMQAAERAEKAYGVA